MDLSQVTNVVSQVTSDSTQGVQGHHHHHRSMADMISKMESAIDDALKAKTLTEDQAGQMKKELDSIAQTLQQGQSSGTQLTSDQLQQIRTEFQDVRKQLFDALNPKAETTTSNGIGSLFQKIDANGDGVVDQNEFFTFISTLE